MHADGHRRCGAVDQTQHHERGEREGGAATWHPGWARTFAVAGDGAATAHRGGRDVDEG